jgi:preprotein translocase subunit YajC
VWNETVVYAQEQAPAGESSQPQGMFPGSFFPFLILMFAVMYFLMIRPNQKRERERRAMLNAIAKGDKVITTGGICGTVVGVNDKTVVLKVSDEPVTKIEFLRTSVAQVAKQDASATASDGKK